MIFAFAGVFAIGYIAGIASIIWWAHYGFNKPKYWWRKEKNDRTGGARQWMI